MKPTNQQISEAEARTIVNQVLPLFRRAKIAISLEDVQPPQFAKMNLHDTVSFKLWDCLAELSCNLEEVREIDKDIFNELLESLKHRCTECIFPLETMGVLNPGTTEELIHQLFKFD